MADEDKPQITQSSNSNESPWDGLLPPPSGMPKEALDKLAASAAAGRKAFDAQTKPRSSGISRAPPPAPRIDPRGGTIDPPKNRIDQDREYSERLRGDIANAIEQNAKPGEPQPAPAPSIGIKSLRQRLWHYADHAVLGLFELLGLLFGLPFGDDLYQDKPVSNLHWVYLVIGCLFAAGGPMFPLTREVRWLPQWVAPSISGAARDARVWIAVLLLFFLYGVAPDIYQRATKPIAVTGAIGAMPIGTTSVDEAVAQATKRISSERDEAVQSGARMAKERDDAVRQLEDMKRQIQNMPPTAHLNYDEPRVFTTKTISELRGFYKDRTALQGAAFMADEIGKWINTEGEIQLIRPDGLVFLSGEGGVISCEFKASWNPKLSAFRPGELMKVVGKIGAVQIGPTPIYLQPCELRN
jgi:hypothetical protein